MNKYSTAQDAESAFYEAFEQADLEGMMLIWAKDDRVVCIHPGAPRMEGLSEVRESWEALFRDPPMLKFSLLDVRITRTKDLAIHQVREEVEIDGQYISMMVSTNVYERDSDKCWYMTSRHSSAEPDDYEVDDGLYEDEDGMPDEAVVFH
ncbi:MAG: nuclear transport factor 2 family protein [Gammaproteobacteria bacterium]|nr:nuclear transport factor 2 family protein [Gammaproteobacteria bacterium]